jgi:hypothetical protein
VIKTADGAVSMTVREPTGAEDRIASRRRGSRTLPTFASRPPEIWTGELKVELSPELSKVRV